MTKKTKVTKPICTRCGIEKSVNADNFYKSYSILFEGNYENRMCVCKECVLEIAEKLKNKYNSEPRALYELCKLLDIYYDNNLYESALKQAKKQNSNVFQIYFQKVSSLQQYRGKVFIDSELFDKGIQNEEIEEKIGRDVIEFWGRGLFSQEDYDFLEREYSNLITRYECDSYALEVLFQEIAHQRLDIKKKREQGQSVDKEIKTLQELLGSSGIKPIQENASMAADQVTFGTLIKKYENERPIPEPDPEWADVDNIKHYISVWFFGHLCAMMGIKNDYAKMYLDEINKNTVEQPEYNEEDSDIDD